MRSAPQLYMKANKLIKKWLFPEKLSSAQVIAGGFLTVILAGGFLLCLPVSSADGTFTDFIDALFTAVTSVCVTGLVTLTTATHWSLFGKVVILVLIQLGGLGVVAVMTICLVAAGRRITLRERMMIQDSFNTDGLSGLVKMIIRVLQGTLLLEAVGAVGYCFVFVPEYGPLKGGFYAVFHAVSAFCNAGIDLVGDSSLVPYVTNPVMNFTTCFLIITGGIGYVVWWDVARVIKGRRDGQIPKGQCFRRLQLHSKLAIVMTAALIVGGTALFFVLEWNNPDTFGALSLPERLMASFFQSVTTRTAGFATVNQGALTEGSAFITMLLMLIGGSPAGTAGGVKTTTVGMLALVVWTSARQKEDVEIFGRRIDKASVRNGLAVFLLAQFIAVTAIVLLLATQDIGFTDISFEVFSALGTAGLTRGITSDFNVFGKLVVILLMYIGRIGPITMVLAFLNRKNDKNGKLRLPKRRVLVG